MVSFAVTKSKADVSQPKTNNKYSIHSTQCTPKIPKRSFISQGIRELDFILTWGDNPSLLRVSDLSLNCSCPRYGSSNLSGPLC